MGTLRALTGRYLNNLERAALTASSVNPNYPLDRLKIPRLSKEFRFNAPGTDDTITADQNLIVNPTVGTWSGGLPLGYTKSGTVVEATGADAHGGAGSAAKVTANFSYLQQIVEVRAGQSMRKDFFAKVSGGAAVASLYIINEETGLYLQSGGGSWGGTQACVSTTSTSYVPLSITFTNQSYDASGDKDTVRLILQWIGAGDAAQFAFFDTFALYPGFDLLAGLAHTFSKRIAPELRGSTDNFASSDVNLAVAMGAYAPAHFYYGLSAVQYYRYVRVKFVGTNPTAARLGKLVVGQTQAPLQHFTGPPIWSRMRDRQTSRGPSGERFGHKRTLFPQRRLTLLYDFESQANFDDFFDIMDRADGDTWPTVVVPDTERPEVLFGYLPNADAYTRELPTLYRNYEFSIEEAPSAPAES